LQMAVGKRAEDLVMDVSEDGKVSSVDARKILRKAVETKGEDLTIETPKPTKLSDEYDRTDAGYFDLTPKGCIPLKDIITIGADNEIEIFFEIKGEAEGYCEIYEKILKDTTGHGLEGKEMTCFFPSDSIALGTLQGERMGDYCSGSLVDSIKDLESGGV